MQVYQKGPYDLRNFNFGIHVHLNPKDLSHFLSIKIQEIQLLTLSSSRWELDKQRLKRVQHRPRRRHRPRKGGRRRCQRGKRRRCGGGGRAIERGAPHGAGTQFNGKKLAWELYTECRIRDTNKWSIEGFLLSVSYSPIVKFRKNV